MRRWASCVRDPRIPDPLGSGECQIGGYELLRDGTKTTTCKSLKSIQELLDEWSIEYDAAIKDPLALAVSVRANWSASWDDGGGSAWIEL